ncbi:MAG TPA: hypothetical protein VH724_13660 [Candidatus Angelobacter sp.]|jgi:hypothetical protein|nr:hypothetical protein [Candidatus Angelobacter sp.]
MNKGELILAIAGTALQACLLVVLLLRRSYKQLPVFCAYVGFSVLSAFLTFAVRNLASFLLYVYWASEALYVVLTFLVLQEAFHSVFRNFYAQRWFKLSFPVIGILILLVAFVRAIFFRPANYSPLAVTLISLEIAVDFLQFLIFFLFILLVRFFHMRWREQTFGIVLGFGIAAAGSLVAFLLRSEFGTKLDPVFRIATPLSYIIGVAIWLATFLKGEPSQPAGNWQAALTPEQMITELRRHTKSVKGILGR